jgi:predicted nucleic acid-binding protein
MKQKTPKNIKAILIDADILIHFSLGDTVLRISDIYPQYEKWVIEVVEKEIGKRLSSAHLQLQFALNQSIFKRVEMPSIKSPAYQEFLRLKRENPRIGEGEAACMAFARFNDHILASSNFRDIRKYCEEHQILYVSTMDLLKEALSQNIMSEEECDQFIQKVKKQGSQLPCNYMFEYTENRTLP